ncbi:MAG: Ryanodine receptor Ryr [Muribaculaceae bacterium]|nr:Ryanodine receptor Ryr [Muribaculaceae bacterium]
MKKNYTPSPIDTSDIELPDELKPLLESMAKNVHEVWAKQRISEGWTYGEKRDDNLRKHPGLVPYEELSEIEKQYDRNTSVETLKLILKLGFHITQNPPSL